MADKIITMDELAKEFKDDPRYKDEPIMAVIGLDADQLVIKHEALMQLKVNDREQILSPILCKGGIGLLHAVAGAGKSHFCLNLAYAIAQGGQFLKYNAPTPRKVLYVDGELGMEDIHRYTAQIARKQGELFFPENLQYFCADQFPNANIPKLDDEHGRRFYIDFLAKHKFDGVFFDNLKMLSNIDENKTTEWNPIQQMLLQLRAKGIFSWLVHHAGADGTKQRGVSARMDAMNTVISLQKFDDEEKAGSIKVVYQKARHFYGNDALDFEAKNHFDGEWSFKDFEISFDDQVWKMIQLKWKDKEIMEELKCSRMRVHRAKKRLEKGGYMF